MDRTDGGQSWRAYAHLGKRRTGDHYGDDNDNNNDDVDDNDDDDDDRVGVCKSEFLSFSMYICPPEAPIFSPFPICLSLSFLSLAVRLLSNARDRAMPDL